MIDLYKSIHDCLQEADSLGLENLQVKMDWNLHNKFIDLFVSNVLTNTHGKNIFMCFKVYFSFYFLFS